MAPIPPTAIPPEEKIAQQLLNDPKLKPLVEARVQAEVERHQTELKLLGPSYQRWREADIRRSSKMIGPLMVGPLDDLPLNYGDALGGRLGHRESPYELMRKAFDKLSKEDQQRLKTLADKRSETWDALDKAMGGSIVIEKGLIDDIVTRRFVEEEARKEAEAARKTNQQKDEADVDYFKRRREDVIYNQQQWARKIREAADTIVAQRLETEMNRPYNEKASEVMRLLEKDVGEAQTAVAAKGVHVRSVKTSDEWYELKHGNEKVSNAVDNAEKQVKNVLDKARTHLKKNSTLNENEIEAVLDTLEKQLDRKPEYDLKSKAQMEGHKDKHSSWSEKMQQEREKREAEKPIGPLGVGALNDPNLAKAVAQAQSGYTPATPADINAALPRKGRDAEPYTAV